MATPRELTARWMPFGLRAITCEACAEAAATSAQPEHRAMTRPLLPSMVGTAEYIGRRAAALKREERLDDGRVELASRRLAQAARGFVCAEPPPVRTVGRHRVERVADQDDPRLDRDLLAGLAVGIPQSVPALVAGADDRPHLRQTGDRREDPLTELRVHLDEPALLVGQRAGLEQDARRNADLAAVVEERAELEPLQRHGLEAELPADLERHVRDPPGVRGGVLVVRLESVRQGLDRGDERLLEALEAAGALERDRCLVGESAEQAQDFLVGLATGARVEDADEAFDGTLRPQRRDRELRSRRPQLLRGDQERLVSRADQVPYGIALEHGMQPRNAALVG